METKIHDIQEAAKWFWKSSAGQVQCEDRFGFTRTVSSFEEAQTFFATASQRAIMQRKAKPELIESNN